MRLMRIALAIAAVLVAAGCLPVTSTTPVGTTVGLTADDALYGTWKGHSVDGDDKSDKPTVYLHFLKGKSGTLSALLVTAAGSKDDDWIAFNLRTATLGKNHYMNAVQTFDSNGAVEGGLKNANIPVLYSFGRHHTLTLYMLDEAKVTKAIQDRKIAGTVESGAFGDVTITADAAALDALMATPEAAKLFKVSFVLKKVE